MANATIGEAVPLEEEAGTARGKREAEEDAGDGGDGGEDEVEERCRVAMWVQPLDEHLKAALHLFQHFEAAVHLYKLVVAGQWQVLPVPPLVQLHLYQHFEAAVHLYKLVVAGY